MPITMRTKTMTAIWGAMIMTVIATPSIWAAKKDKTAPQTQLTEVGGKLEARYSGQLKALQVEIPKAVPAVGEQKKAAYLKAREEEKTAEPKANAAQAALDKSKGHTGL